VIGTRVPLFGFNDNPKSGKIMINRGNTNNGICLKRSKDIQGIEINANPNKPKDINQIIK
jgi:hypothetical protein